MDSIKFSIEELSGALINGLPDAAFAFLFGSSFRGSIENGSDIDIAVYYKNVSSPGLDLIDSAISVVEAAVPGAVCDLTILNTSGVIVSFEALRGRRLFVREESLEEFASFYASTCMRYEEEIWWMNRQLEYRGYEIQRSN